MHLIFDADNTDIIGDSNIVNKDKMTTIDQGSNSEKFDNGFIAETNQEKCPEEPKEDENCPELPREEENCPEVPKEDENCPEVPKDENVQDNDIIMDDVPNQDVSHGSQTDATETQNKKIQESYDSAKETLDKEILQEATKIDPIEAYKIDPVEATKIHTVEATKIDPFEATKIDPVEATKIIDPVEATKIDPVEVTKIDPVEVTKIHPVDPAESAETNATVPENNIETTIQSSVSVETSNSDEKLIEDVEMTDEKVIEEDNSANNLDIKLKSEAIPTSNITEEAIEKKTENTESLDIDKKYLAASESTCHVTVEEKANKDQVLDDCMAGAGDSEITDTQIKEKLTEKDTCESPVELEKPNTELYVDDVPESLKPEEKEQVSDLTVDELKHVNSEERMVTDETEKITENDNLDLMGTEVEKTLDEPLKLDESLEIDEKILNEPLDTAVTYDKESASEISQTTQSGDEKLEIPAKTKPLESDLVTEKSSDEKLPESEGTVENLGSDALPDNVDLDSKSSESIVAITSSSEAMEAKSDESITSDDIFDGKTSPVEIDTSQKDDVPVGNTIENRKPLETIIEETKSAETISEESTKSDGVKIEKATESIDVDDVDMEPVVTDMSKEENMSIDCDDSISFVTANDNDDVSIVGDSKEAEMPLEKTVDEKIAIASDDVTIVSDTKEIEKPLEKPTDDEKLSESISKPEEKKDAFKIQLSNNLDILSDDEEESSKQADKEVPSKKHAETETPSKTVTVVTETPSKTVTVEDSPDLDILSDDDEKSLKPSKSTEIATSKTVTVEESQDKTINLDDDDDDLMVIDDDTSLKDMINQKSNNTSFKSNEKFDSPAPINMQQDQISIETIDSKEGVAKEPAEEEKEESTPEPPTSATAANLPTEIAEKPTDTVEPEPKEKRKPLVPENFFKSYKKNLSEMSRDDLEEFCILKIVESIIDRSTLNETKTKLKAMTQSAEEYKKKALSMIKQHRDLQVVLKSVQEEQKNNSTTPIAPLKITRSVGMQVLMTDKNRRKPVTLTVANQNPNTSQNNAKQAPKPKPKPPARPPKLPVVNSIPVPRLVPASNIAKAQVPNKPMTNGIKTPPVQKPEKRTHSRMTSQSVTVDLTDDEPPAKVVSKSPGQPVRLVPPQNLMTARGQNFTTGSSPRKVFIPISGPGSQQLRPGQTIMVKNIPGGGGPRQRNPNATIRSPQNATRVPRPAIARHPAPLPDAMKQYQPPNWKALPPAPDLKLSKVENGIVISWKIDGYQEDSYEEIASYQLFAYQETSTPPNTNLWKKIGDVKALPLPMACTLTQFMAGYKYYFAVRAVDIRSRLGPFSMPGSILLLNKM